MSKEIFELTKEQQKAFNRLKKAHADCLKTGIYFFNNYGAYCAVNKSIICGYGDMQIPANGVSEVSVNDAGEPQNYIQIANEWSDDPHIYGLTEEGHDIYFKD